MVPLCKDSLEKIAAAHIRMFENRLRLADKVENINAAECSRYLTIWRNVQTRASYSELSPAELGEVIDARADGGYDHLLRPEEILKGDEVFDDD
jgi:hypothetical protein